MQVKNCQWAKKLSPLSSYKEHRVLKVFKNLLILSVMIGWLSVGVSCSVTQSQQTSPTVTLSAMLKTAEVGNWEKYVDEYYGEQHKFQSPSDREALISRFRERWGNQVIAGLKEASQVEPELSEDGKKAIFQLSNGEFILYKNEQGDWTFHL